ncbi:hypothetical protein ACQ4PT_040737 [Festuca glaucescens]
MAKKMKERPVNVSGKTRHSLDVNRPNDKKGASGGGGCRSAATVRRLKMYKLRPKRDRGGKIKKHDLQSEDLPNTRIEPDRRWYGNTRVASQELLDFMREELKGGLSNNYSVVLKPRKLPLSLVNYDQKDGRAHILDTEPFEHAFGPKGKRKRPKLSSLDYESLIKKADDSQDAFKEKHASSKLPKDEQEDGLRDPVRHNMFEKGQSKRIWGELYKVIDSSDVVVQVLDARDPMGTRCYHLEKHLKENAKHKHLVRVTNLDDASEHIGEVLRRVKKENLQRAYKIQHWANDNDFLVQLSKMSGKLLKGGEPDLATAAKMVLHDWQRGKIPFFVPPPQQKEDGPSEIAESVEKSGEEVVISDQTAEAMKEIAGIISSQQTMNVPCQTEFGRKNEDSELGEQSD